VIKSQRKNGRDVGDTKKII